MQFFILLLGVLVFAFYQFQAPPLSFNSSLISEARSSTQYKDSLQVLQNRYDSINVLKQQKAVAFTDAIGNQQVALEQQLSAELKEINVASEGLRTEFKTLSQKVSGKDTNDTNYVFLAFVKEYLPSGLRGLLIAVIFLAAWGSIAAALNSLAATSVVDLHQRMVGKEKRSTNIKFQNGIPWVGAYFALW